MKLSFNSILKIFNLIFIFASSAFSEMNSSQCPEGHNPEKSIPIVYGLPGEELMKSAEKGDVLLGGCVIRDKAPHWYCKECQQRW